MTARSWIVRAACSGMSPGVFFPTETDEVPSEVERVCRSCPVRAQCLAWALRHEDFGVWAGTTPADRRRMRRRGETGTGPSARSWPRRSA